MHEAHRVKAICAEKQRLSGLGLPMPAGLASVVPLGADSASLWRRYVASPQWVTKRGTEVRSHAGDHGLPPTMKPADAGSLVSSDVAERTKFLPKASVATALILEAEPDEHVTKTITNAVAKKLYECTEQEAKKTFAARALVMVAGLTDEEAKRDNAQLTRTQFDVSPHALITLGKALHQVRGYFETI